LSAPGRTYILPKSENVSSNAWHAAAFAQTANETPAHTFFASDADANVTLYLLPTTNSPTFFRLEAQ
jgi:hypothetical protein